jgi:hypothetical protein
MKKLVGLFLLIILLGAGCDGPSADEIARAIHDQEYNKVLFQESTSTLIAGRIIGEGIFRDCNVENYVSSMSSTSFCEIKNDSFATKTIWAPSSTIVFQPPHHDYKIITTYKDRVEIESRWKGEEYSKTYNLDERTRKFFDPKAEQEIKKFRATF